MPFKNRAVGAQRNFVLILSLTPGGWNELYRNETNDESAAPAELLEETLS